MREIVYKLLTTVSTKILGTFPPNAVCSVSARLLVLLMLFIAVNSPNLAHHLWEGKKKTAKRPTILTETVVSQKF